MVLRVRVHQRTERVPLLFEGTGCVVVVVESLGLSAAFDLGPNNLWLLALSSSEMKFKNLESGELVRSNIRRTGFVAQSFFDRFFSAVLLQNVDEFGRKFNSPGLFVPPNLGNSLSTELITLKKEEALNTSIIWRPLAYRLLPLQGCESLNPSAAYADQPSALNFICPNKLVRIKLK